MHMHKSNKVKKELYFIHFRCLRSHFSEGLSTVGHILRTLVNFQLTLKHVFEICQVVSSYDQNTPSTWPLWSTSLPTPA